jgi:hypothetical protein
MMVDDDGIHVDEGTIHAWLDGELDEALEARIQAHIGRCGACAAHVAEARGLIAGASRVIGMLDEVPAPFVRPAVARTAADDMSVWRLLRVTPARASIAAMLVVAVGIALTRGQLSREVPVSSRGQDAAAPMSATAAPAAPVTAVPTPDTILGSAIARRLAAEQPPRTMERAPGVSVPSAPAMASPAPNADLADAESKVAAGRAPVVAGRVMAAAGADRTRAGVGQQVRNAAVTTGVAASAAKAADAASAGAPSSARAFATDAIAAGQCYRVESPSPAVWGSVRLPMVVAMDSTGQEGRVLTPTGDDTQARAYLQYNGADSAFFRLRRIGFNGTMTLLAASGMRTGTMQSSSAQATVASEPAGPSRRAAVMSAQASNAGAAQAAITARRVACPQAP